MTLLMPMESRLEEATVEGSEQLSMPGPWGCEDEEGQGVCPLSPCRRD